MTGAIQEFKDTSSVALSGATTKGMDSWAIESMKETVLDINDALAVTGKALHQIAADLFEIKKNIKPGNWKAFLASGVLACTPRYATDLVNAHEKWLITADVDPALLAQMSPRTLVRLANASDAIRKKVFALFKTTDPKFRVTEAAVNAVISGGSKKKKAVTTKTVDERVTALQEEKRKLVQMNAELRKQNLELKKLLVKAAEEGVTPAVASAVKV